MSALLSAEELHAELEKGYADMKAGRTKDAQTVFDDIRKDYNRKKIERNSPNEK